MQEKVLCVLLWAQSCVYVSRLLCLLNKHTFFVLIVIFSETTWIACKELTQICWKMQIWWDPKSFVLCSSGKLPPTASLTLLIDYCRVIVPLYEDSLFEPDLDNEVIFLTDHVIAIRFIHSRMWIILGVSPSFTVKRVIFVHSIAGKVILFLLKMHKPNSNQWEAVLSVNCPKHCF